MKILNSLKQLFRLSDKKTPYNMIPEDRFKEVIQHPWAIRKLMTISREQDKSGSHYHGILNTIANDCVGPCPVIIGQTESSAVNADIEERWLRFCQLNQIGAAVRLIRRAAAKTGMGIAIPYKRNNAISDEVRLGLRIIPTERLGNPLTASFEDRIFDGIEYDENWDIKRIYLDTGEEYKASDIILWYKQKDEGQIRGIPECGPAMCVFPSVKRFLDALVRSAEFKSCIPAVVKLDPHVWGKSEASAAGISMPQSKFTLTPGTIPTLPPGTSLEGLSGMGLTAEDAGALDLMVGAAARCVNMPINLATGNSSKHNMASSQVDFGPWKNTVSIDREDFAVVIHQLFHLWLKAGSLIPNYFTAGTRQFIAENSIKYSIAHKQVFNHPDPSKVSNSRFTDLISGTTTLTRIYTEEGLNPRKELEREAKLLGVTYEEYAKTLIASRSTSAIKVISDDNQTTREERVESEE